MVDPPYERGGRLSSADRMIVLLGREENRYTTGTLRDVVDEVGLSQTFQLHHGEAQRTQRKDPIHSGVAAASPLTPGDFSGYAGWLQLLDLSTSVITVSPW
jgi:hypothetical protein